MTDAMPANPQNASPFTRYFLPGLVLGLIIGAFAGVILTPILGGNQLPKPTGIPPSTTYMPREGEQDESSKSAETPPEQTQPDSTPPDDGAGSKQPQSPENSPK